MLTEPSFKNTVMVSHIFFFFFSQHITFNNNQRRKFSI
ncbi:unnamed protein product [Brassica rapa subsp. narinosa]